MAISKITTESTSDASVIKSFLDENKAGTFLEDAEISADGVRLTITMGEAVFTVILRESAQSSSVIEAITMNSKYETTYSFKIGGVNLTNVGFWFKGAALCSNGLILHLYLRTSSHYTDAYCLLTVDSTGNLVMIYERTNTGSDISTVGTGYRLAGYNCRDAVAVELHPYFGSPLTSLSPVSPMTADNSILISNVFVATQSQLTTRGLASMATGTDNYITNGVWFVKD